MYVCIVNQAGAILVHRNIKTDPAGFLEVIAPYRDDLAVAVECIFTGYGLADRCAREGIPFVLGYAPYMKAIHGGKVKNDRIDSQKIAVLLRGGMVPHADVYPERMRAPRDLLRRRLHLRRFRADPIAHIQNTASQYNVPPLAERASKQSERPAIPAHFPDPVVRQMIRLDLDAIAHPDEQWRVLEQDLALKAKAHDAFAYHLIRSVPGIGRILTLVILYEIERIERFATVGQCASYARSVKRAQESAGERHGYSSQKIGNADLKWVFGEAAVLFLRNNPPAPQAIQRRASRHGKGKGKGKALSILAHQSGRAVYVMLRKRQPFDQERFTTSLSVRIREGAAKPTPNSIR